MRAERRAGVKDLTDLVKSAITKAVEFENNDQFVSEEKERFGTGKSVEGSLKAYYKEFRKVGGSQCRKSKIMYQFSSKYIGPRL